ncbi:hypothetical protein GCM10023324_42190 [Streptomyces youssoufiensis]
MAGRAGRGESNEPAGPSEPVATGAGSSGPDQEAGPGTSTASAWEACPRGVSAWDVGTWDVGTWDVGASDGGGPDGRGWDADASDVSAWGARASRAGVAVAGVGVWRAGRPDRGSSQVSPYGRRG